MYEFRIGSVIADTFRVLWRNIVVFAVLALTIEAVNIGQNYLFVTLEIPTRPGLSVLGFLDPLVWAAFSVDLLVNSLLVAPVTYVTYFDLRGSPAPFRSVVTRGLALVPKVFVLSVIFTFLLVSGLVLLVVPGLFVIVLWWIVVPVLVTESPGIWKCFQRSRELTRRHRWRMFGIFLLIIVVPFFVAMAVLMMVAFAAFSSWWITLGVDWVLSTFWILLMTITPAVVYFHLRRAKEGIAIADIAAVFD